MKKRILTALAATFFLSAATNFGAGAAPGLSSIERDELQMSYALVTAEFYKKVDPQTQSASNAR